MSPKDIPRQLRISREEWRRRIAWQYALLLTDVVWADELLDAMALWRIGQELELRGRDGLETLRIVAHCREEDRASVWNLLRAAAASEPIERASRCAHCGCPQDVVMVLSTQTMTDLYTTNTRIRRALESVGETNLNQYVDPRGDYLLPEQLFEHIATLFGSEE